MKRLDFESLTALLQEGKHKTIPELMGVSEDFVYRYRHAVSQFTEDLIRLVEKEKPVIMLSEDTVLTLMFKQMDEHVKPKTASEVALSAYLAGKVVNDIPGLLKKKLGLHQAPDSLTEVLATLLGVKKPGS